MPKFSVKKPLTVFVAVLAVVILGIVAYMKMTPDLLPNMNFPYVIIVTTDPGASPEAIEKNITRPVEESMSTLDQIKSVTSTSQNSVSMVTLEFEESVNMDSISVDIQQKISALQGEWDDTVAAPYVLKINPSMLPVQVAAVSYDGKNTYEMSEFVEDTLHNRLSGITGVASIDINGMVERKLHLLLDQEKLDALSATLSDAINKQLDDAEGQLNDARQQVLDAQAALKNMQEDTMDETAETVVYALQSALRALRTGGNNSEETLAELREIRDERDRLEAERAPFDERIEAIENDETLTDAEKEEQIAAIKSESEYVRIEAEMAALDLRLAALGSNWEDLDTDIEMKEEEQQEILDLLQRIENDDDLSDIVDQVSDGLITITDAMMQLISANIQLEDALKEIEAGLLQLDAARKDALAAADMSSVMNINTLSSLLMAQNFSMPAGYLTEEGVSYMVSVGDSITSQQTLEDMILFDLGMEGIEPITLKDVAAVFITDNSEEIYAKLNNDNGVIVSFTKQSTYATAEVSNNIAAAFEELEAEFEGLSFEPLMDQGDYIYLIMETILSSLGWGVVFSVLILWLFLRDIRPTIITLCSIPISLVFAIVLMYFSGVTINMISLSGLAVSVGMLVDNSVVVIENIYRLRNKGATVIQAAVSGTQQVLGAITSSTLTTVCVFLPIVFVEGLTRQLFTDLALTMTYSLMASLVVALTLVPAMASGMLRKQKEQKPGVLDRLAPYYRKAVSWSLAHKAIVLLLATVMLIVSTGLTLMRGFTFMPNIDMNMLNMTIVMPEGIEREEAVALADEVLERASGVADVQTIGATMSSSGTNALTMSSTATGPYDVTAYITLPEGKFGSVVGKEIEELCADLDCTVTTSGPLDMMTMLTGSGVTINVYGEDMEDLHTAAQLLAETIEGVPGTTEVSDGLEDAATALHISIDRNKAMKKGMTVAQIYMQIASALTTSADASDMTMDGLDVGVTIEGSESSRLTRDTLLDLEITVDSGTSMAAMGGSASMGSTSSMSSMSSMGSTAGTASSDTEKANSFKLSEVATIEETVSLNNINHDEQRRYVAVSAAIAEGHNVTLVTADVEKAVAKLELPKGVTVEFTGENEMIMDAMFQLVLMLLLGVVLVYFIMVAQFQSLRSPFIVMFTIPLAFTGGFFALLIAGIEVSVISLIGFVMLVGIIVNNGIVLVDYINQLRLEGVERQEAIVEAGITRLRPILMTSITTILGMVVTALAKNAGTALMQPVALVCIGGLTYATLMTLLVVPCMYDLIANRDLRKVDEEELKLLDI